MAIQIKGLAWWSGHGAGDRRQVLPGPARPPGGIAGPGAFQRVLGPVWLRLREGLREGLRKGL